MLDLKPEELSYAEALMYRAKFEEALDIISNFEKKESKIPEHQLSIFILRGKIYCYRDQYKEAVKSGELAYDLSSKVGNIPNSIDALIIMAHIVCLGKLEQAREYISEAERLFKSISEESSPDIKRLQADLLLIRTIFYTFSKDLNKSLESALQWLKLREETGEKLDISRIYSYLSGIYLFRSEPNTALNYAESSLKLQKDLNNPVGVSTSLYLIGAINLGKGDFDQALKFCKQSLAIKEISVFTKIDTLHTLGVIYKEKGELDRALRYYNRAASLEEQENEIDRLTATIIGIGSTYRMKGSHERATEYLKRSLTLSKNINSLYGMNSSLFYLVLLNLDKNNHEQAQQILANLEELGEKTESKVFQQVYLIAKALVLKNSGRIRNRTEAEILLRQIAEEEFTMPRLYLLAMVNLCDLFLEELHITNNLEILEEINPLIIKIYEFAENQHSYLWLAETKLIQAKLALIQMDIEEAKRLLTQAQQIAEMHGLDLLAIKISSEHDNLLEQINVWDNLKRENAPMAERIKLASFNGVIDRMQGKSSVEVPKLTHELPVLLLIIGEGGIPLFSNPFIEEWSFDDDIISGFLTAFNAFSGELFAKRLDRAKFGEYKILMQAVNSFSVCYLFKGQTYLAKQKLTEFVERIQKYDPIWKTMKEFYKTNRVIELKDSPFLESLIDEIFIRKIPQLNI